MKLGNGATIPAAIEDASGLPNLVTALQASGFDEESIRKMAFEKLLT
jgi:membrane dipeptidase